MKLSPASLRTLRQTATLAPCLLALAWLAGACSSDDKTTNPPTNPPPDASEPTSDGAIPPPPEVDAGGVFCGTEYCPNKISGGQRGIACCTPQMHCGLNFGGLSGCVDQTDAGGGGTPMPPADAGPIKPDPSCGTVSIDFNGQMFPLDGCCLPSGTCGWYSPQMSNFGCVGADGLRMVGLPVIGLPDAPIVCTP